MSDHTLDDHTLDDHTAGRAPGDRPTHELVHRAVRERPHATALAWAGTSVSYRELERRAAAIGAALRSDRVPVAGAAVAVRMAPGPAYVAALLAVFDTGAHVVCLGARDEGERARSVLAELRPVCLLLDGRRAGDTVADFHEHELGGRVLDTSTIDPGPVDPGLGDTGPVDPGTGDTDRQGALDPDGRAYVAYTSGSLGRPKGLTHTHRALSQFVTWFATEFRIGPGARVAQWAAPGYDAALCEVFAALVGGATLCPVPERMRADPGNLVEWLADERVTHLQTVPSFARRLLQAAHRRDPAAPPLVLGHVLLAGEVLTTELAAGLRAQWPAARVLNLYGPTESILATWFEVPREGVGTGAVPIGRSIPGRHVVVLDPDDRPCPAGVTGEIVIHSPHLAEGYTGGYRTGDLGLSRPDGTLEFRGRRDRQVKVSGVRLELAEVEAALLTHESVLDCAVVAVPDEAGLVARLVAVVVAAPGADPRAWRSHLRRRFGSMLLPLTHLTVDQLPRNVGGKVDRRQLTALAGDRPAAQPPADQLPAARPPAAHI